MRSGIVSTLCAVSMLSGLAACETPCEYPECAWDICSSTCGYYESWGLCFEKTTRCCSDSDCPVGTCDTAIGFCWEFEVCGCERDDTCPMGYICVSNHSACGMCIEEPRDCAGDDDCDAGSYCKGNTCQESCCE